MLCCGGSDGDIDGSAFRRSARGGGGDLQPPGAEPMCGGDHIIAATVKDLL
ncbi:unnamed protein product [Camellia sinensis]